MESNRCLAMRNKRFKYIKNQITNPDEIKKMTNYNKSVPVILSFDDQHGDLERVNQTEYIKEQLIVRPRVFYRRSNDEYIIYSSKRKSDKLGTLKLQ